MDKIELLQKYINESDNIVFFGGAGVSTDSGIPDFRGKNGLYNKKNIYSNEPPEYMLSNICLYSEPDKFFNYYRNNMNCLNAKPNITHLFLKKLEDENKLKAIITQNIDGLHQKAGSKNVLELHGTIYKAHCSNCKKEYDGEYIFNSKNIPLCKCGGIIRPNVVLYGESLPDDFDESKKYISKCDLLIVAGTSLTVEPASSLIKIFDGKHLVIINGSKTQYDYLADLIINEPLKDVIGKLK